MFLGYWKIGNARNCVPLFLEMRKTICEVLKKKIAKGEKRKWAGKSLELSKSLRTQISPPFGTVQSACLHSLWGREGSDVSSLQPVLKCCTLPEWPQSVLARALTTGHDSWTLRHPVLFCCLGFGVGPIQEQKTTQKAHKSLCFLENECTSFQSVCS